MQYIGLILQGKDKYLAHKVGVLIRVEDKKFL